MENIEKYRKKIDYLDTHIVKFLEKRIHFSKEIGKEKSSL